LKTGSNEQLFRRLRLATGVVGIHCQIAGGRGTIECRMDALGLAAERRIAEAIAAGEFDGLAGLGRPLELEDTANVDPELRSCYLVLRSAGVLPEEMALRKEILTLGDLLRACEEPAERDALADRRKALLLRHEVLMERLRRPARGGGADR
jgi:hypothetical protein